jgi:hypothetical protein
MSFNEQVAPIEVFAANVYTGAGTTNSSAIDRNSYGDPETHTFLLSCGARSGTNPTLDVKVQESDTGTGDWTDVGASGTFAQMTNVGFQERTVRNTKRFLRVVRVLGGTTPSFTLAVICLAGDPLRGNI